MKYYGYKLKSVNLKDINMELKEAFQQVNSIANDEFSKLVGEEAAFIADNIALGVISRDPEKDIVEVALENVSSKIRQRNLMRVSGRYNFSLFGYLFPYKKDVYLHVDLLNPVFEKAFHYLEDVSVDEVEMQDDTSYKRKLWTDILQNNNNPVSINMTPELSCKTPVFPKKAERVEILARHRVTNKLLSDISGNEKIPPFLLMRYMDEALLKLPEMETEIKKYKMELQQILLDFSKKEARDSLKTFEAQEKLKNQKKEEKTREEDPLKMGIKEKKPIPS